ncbi:DinB family protein [Reichenbachiella sp.]|uniref:DinB family protein n=1 Tax=Reichenbachiella sp. TaxID=2184521 RepID=UPI003BAF713C
MKFLLFFFSLISFSAIAQDSTDYYYKIPEYPDNYNAGTVAARVVDGLGFRYYWGTVGLRSEDLDYKPSPEARTAAETIDHIYGLTNILVNSTRKIPTDFTKVEEKEMTFEEKRAKTLQNVKEASEILKQSTAEDLESYKIIFISSRGQSEYPFWNQLNGPLADAIWHVGQVVSMRRSSGNPFNSNVSVLRGRLKD